MKPEMEMEQYMNEIRCACNAVPTCSLTPETVGNVSSTVEGASSSTSMLLTIEAPKQGPYSGANMVLQIRDEVSQITWSWQSSIYHPIFVQGKQLCKCITLNANGSRRNPSFIISDVISLLEKPHYSLKCDECDVNDAAFAEMKIDCDFFLRKARVHTPGADLVRDEDLRAIHSPLTAEIGKLLFTGAYSDVKVVVSKSVFRCHRTVLSARSAVFKRMFDCGGDAGILRICDTNACAFGRLLQFIYSEKLCSRESLDIHQHFDVYELAHRFQIVPLSNYHASCLAALVTIENVLRVSKMLERTGDRNLLNALARFAEIHNVSAEELPCEEGAWRRMRVSAHNSRHAPY